MLQIATRTYKVFPLEHLVLDYNGTLAFDGPLGAGVTARRIRLLRAMNIDRLI
jgi:hypothetical protein